MKTTCKSSLKLSIALSLAAAFALSQNVSAQTVTKADNTLNLNGGTSYVGGVAPTASDTINIDSTLTVARSASLGGAVSALGINQTNPGGQFQINATGANALSLGAGGITVTGGTAFNFVMNAPLVTTAAQTWNVASGRVIQFAAGGSITETGGAVSVAGAGGFDYRGGVGSVSGVVSTASVGINNVAAALTLGGTANTFVTLNVFTGRVLGSTLGNFGVASSFGTGGTNTVITLGGSATSGVLEYTGTTASSNRTINRDGRAAASGITITNAGQTLSLSANLGSGSQVNTGTNGWVFAGAGNLTSTGVIANSTGVGSTGTTITKNGTGTLTLGGASANTFTGAVTVNDGALVAATNKALGDTTSVSVVGGNLDLRGSTASTVTLGAAAAFSLSGTGNIKLQLGTNFDQLVTSGAGTFTITGGNFELDVTGAGFSYGNTYQVLSGFGGTNSVAGLTFSGYDTVNQQAALSNTGVLSFSAVPEPSTYAMILGGLGLFALVNRRRRSA